MNKIGTITLTTERLVLRKFCLADAFDMYEHWASDPEVTEFLSWQPHKDVSASAAYITGLMKDYDNNMRYDWAIELQSTGEVIGSIGFIKCDYLTNTVRVGYCIGKKWWHRGIMTEALACIIRFAFEIIKTNRFESMHDVNNPNSGKVMQKCGLRYEGTQLQAGYNNAGICDLACYALLRAEYLEKFPQAN